MDAPAWNGSDERDLDDPNMTGDCDVCGVTGDEPCTPDCTCAYCLRTRPVPQKDERGVSEQVKDCPYTWRVGDVFTDGTYRWAVDSIHGEQAILRSCGSSWATTIPLTFSAWREGGRWRLESQKASAA